jgi:hypothetical protein
MSDLASAEYLLAAAMFLAALLYASVGHGGASAYLALMALFGVAAPVMRPTALVLNILVAGLGTWRFARAGYFRWRTLWPFLLGALPMAWIGGSVNLPGPVYRPLVGIVLLLAAARLLWPGAARVGQQTDDAPIPLALVLGAAIGLLSGLTGTGGGIFLSPVLLFMGWSRPKDASGVAAAFILANSVAGLAGNLAAVRSLPEALPVYAGAVLAGALLGTMFGIRTGAPRVLRALGAVLTIAGLKLLFAP